MDLGSSCPELCVALPASGQSLLQEPDDFGVVAWEKVLGILVGVRPAGRKGFHVAIQETTSLPVKMVDEEM